VISPEELAAQRWFAGHQPPKSLKVLYRQVLAPGLEWGIVEADGVRYQLVLDGDGNDALRNSESALALLPVVTDGDEKAEVARPLTVEQSNSSVVYDDRLILKLFRRLPGGANPEVEVTAALVDHGFESVAKPVAVWRRTEGRITDDLAIVQEYLAGGMEGWALALTSLRDLLGGDDVAEEAGGDFAAEAERLGEVSARMHLALAEAFGSHPADGEAWAGLMERQLERVGAEAKWRDQAARVFGRLRKATDLGRQIRVHGDYHLGQTMRTDSGWYVLDFEGEPARPIDERTRPTSPIKDVTGMLRSFGYAAAVALSERGQPPPEGCVDRTSEWEVRNRRAYLEGYLATDGIDALLPSDAEARHLLLDGWELDKAIYELAYERAHRPDWASIPEAAILRLLGG
jgi:maltokinase